MIGRFRRYRAAEGFSKHRIWDSAHVTCCSVWLTSKGISRISSVPRRCGWLIPLVIPGFGERSQSRSKPFHKASIRIFHLRRRHKPRRAGGTLAHCHLRRWDNGRYTMAHIPASTYASARHAAPRHALTHLPGHTHRIADNIAADTAAIGFVNAATGGRFCCDCR